MNPQDLSISFLIATGHIRAMRGGAQSHMLTASDGYAYVVKFANNPQSLRILANEWLACSIGRAIGLTIPEPAILYVPAKLVESSSSGDTPFQFNPEMFTRAGIRFAFHFSG
jgi:hypothetical protein